VDVSLGSVVCCQRPLRGADHSYRGVLPIVIEEPQRGGLAPLGLSSHEKKKVERDTKTAA
jgi:hypothetical protein